MCRAIWALAIGPDEEACGKIRRAAGADVQVIAMATTLDRARELIGDTELDVAIVDATTPDAYGIVTKLRRLHPKVGVVWIGSEAPEIAHAAVEPRDLDADHVPSAVTRALLARR
jgi:hypothetical protein